ncbi:uncharacterized protein LOC131944789 [Physella acuta]|uniref:uncharacterized protein LOC131944789 n=1 Tax=Physella acuta TaxID=109671 RepID=UPI0027DD5F51|nr:uncharacterized protein LOC131944789 [Physella acuta]
MKFPICLLKQGTGRRVFTHPINPKMTLDIQVQYHQRQDGLKSSHVTVYLNTSTLAQGRILIDHAWSVTPRKVKANRTVEVTGKIKVHSKSKAKRWFQAHEEVQTRVCMNGFTFGHDMSVDLDLKNCTGENVSNKVTIFVEFHFLGDKEVNAEFKNLKKIFLLSQKKRYHEDLATKSYMVLNELIDPTKLLRCIKKSNAGLLNKKEITKIKCILQEKDYSQSLRQLMFHLSCKKKWISKLINILQKRDQKKIYFLLQMIQFYYGDHTRGWTASYILTKLKEPLDVYKSLQKLAVLLSLAVMLSVIAFVIAVHAIYTSTVATQNLLSIQIIPVKSGKSFHYVFEQQKIILQVTVSFYLLHIVFVS